MWHPPTSSSSSSSHRLSPISHRTHLLCLRQRRRDSQTDLSQSVLLLRCGTHSYFYLFLPKKKKQKNLPNKDWIWGPSFQCWETPDKVKSTFYQLSTILHNFCICVFVCSFLSVSSLFLRAWGFITARDLAGLLLCVPMLKLMLVTRWDFTDNTGQHTPQ